MAAKKFKDLTKDEIADICGNMAPSTCNTNCPLYIGFELCQCLYDMTAYEYNNIQECIDVIKKLLNVLETGEVEIGGNE